MSLRWKDSVRFDKLHGAIVLALMRAERIFEDAGEDCWITSGNDSEHMVGSKHYDGRAVDLRLHHITNTATRTLVVSRLRAALGPEYTLLHEDPGKPDEHAHLQFNGV